MFTYARKLKTVRQKIVFATLPTVVISFTLLAIVLNIMTSSLLNAEIDEKMKAQLVASTELVTNGLNSHKMLPISLAATVRSIGIDSKSKSDFINLVKQLPTVNDDTLGAGIFMADKYQGDYYCPYAYKSEGQVIYTEDYFVDNTSEAWYLVGDTKEPVAWSEPYYDPMSGITMITAASPIRDNHDVLKGVATADLDFTHIQAMFSKIKVGKEGYAILISEQGAYLSYGSKELAINENGELPSIKSDKNESLRTLGHTAMRNGTGSGSFNSEEGKMRVVYSKIPETGWVILLAIPETEISSSLKHMMFVTLIITTCAIALLGFFITLISRSITRPLGPLRESIQIISKGDFSIDIACNTQDEIGDITKSLNQMIKSLKELFFVIHTQSSIVASTAEELEASACQNGLAVEQVALSVSSISDANIEISQLSQKLNKDITGIEQTSMMIANQMDHVSDSMQTIKSVTSISTGSVNQLTSSMIRVFDDSQGLLKIMEDLNLKSTEIDKILESILNISTQTNLLALNASIEAARAGDAGKGFAVVADEIRKLAEQSSRSASTISSIINSVIAATKSAYNSTAIVVNSLNEGKEAITIVKDNFDLIQNRVENVDTLIGDANYFARNILCSTNSVGTLSITLAQLTGKSADDATAIAASTEEQLATFEEQSSAVTNLSQIAEDLEEKIRFIKI